ncbi:Fic family protein [Dyadobacter luticola]|uniref:Fic family protein n=1 Tax=Dyadobacter luticola TaxID=1979387 RepID=A0A5R9KP21_9BACT|nr:Fic family protein [Dyadobacter luticola]TLU97930.1 Fic family protein [Dyadobacter luticola]
MEQPFELSLLPLSVDVETRKVLRKVTEAHKHLAELKGTVRTIPNESILINTLVLQEAKDSSAVENIITTHDEIFKAELLSEHVLSWETKEVINYARALRKGFALVKESGFLSSNYIIQIQEELEANKAGFRRVPGTVLKNEASGQVVFTPPQKHDEIVRLMSNLEKYMNEHTPEDLDPLVKMAIIHYQFESIHPFYDGNGRTGRIINILYLTMMGLLDIPILYLSRYIIQHKPDYYRLLQEVRTKDNWEEWILFMLVGVKETASDSILLIDSIRNLMDNFKQEIRTRFPKMYSKDLLETLFKHPYTKIEFLENDLGIHYQTARTYLEKLSQAGLVEKVQLGKSNFYVNQHLFRLFAEAKNRS